MNNKMKKAIAFAVSVASVLSFTGCKKEVTENPDKEVTLKWILSGSGKQLDSKEVWETFNEKLKDYLPNTKVEFENISTSDYAEKWKLIAASKEDVDMAWHGWMIPFNDEVHKGAYMQLDDLLEEYGPKLKETLPDWVWDTTRVDGKIYAIPNYQMMVNRPGAFRTYGELADKYLDKDGIAKAFEKASKVTTLSDPITEECFDYLDDYLGKLKANGELGLGISTDVFSWFAEVGGSIGEIKTGYVFDENGKFVVKDGFSKDISKNFYKRIAEFYQKGYIRKDALTSTDTPSGKTKDDRYVLWYHQYDDFSAQQEEIQKGEPIYLIKRGFQSTYYGSTGGTNSVIPTTSKNPGRAMELYQLINTEEGKELYNMLVYGLEGKHYEKTGENTIKTLCYEGSPTSDSDYGVYKWIVGNTFNAYETQTDVPGYNDYIVNELHPSAVRNKLDGFVFDETPVKSELVQIDNIKSEFKGLRVGAYENWEEMVDNMRKKMEKAGNAKVIAEIQRQLDEWVKENKK